MRAAGGVATKDLPTVPVTVSLGSVAPWGYHDANLCFLCVTSAPSKMTESGVTWLIMPFEPK